MNKSMAEMIIVYYYRILALLSILRTFADMKRKIENKKDKIIKRIF